MRRKVEPVAIFLTSPSSSDEDASDNEKQDKSVGKRMRRASGNSSTKQTENNSKTCEQEAENTIVQDSSEKTHSDLFGQTDPVLNLKDRPNKPALKGTNFSREDKDIKVGRDCDHISNYKTFNSLCPPYNQGNQSCCYLLIYYFYSLYLKIKRFKI